MVWHDSRARQTLVVYSKTDWNRPCDDGQVMTRGTTLVISQITPGPDWQAFFKQDGTDTLYFTKDGELDRETAFTIKDFEDCTHYINRCLIRGGVSTPITAWAPT